MKTLRERLLRLGLEVTHRMRHRNLGPASDFRTKTPRKRPLVMVWAMRADWTGSSNLSQLEMIREIGEVVVVLEDCEYSAIIDRACFIEVLPTSNSRELLPFLDWPLYVERRIDRIRDAWRPDIELTMGLAPEQFLEQLAEEQAGYQTRVHGETEDEAYEPPG
jgi:hypothetical protein